MTSSTATVETLAAEVRVLMVGNRQVTLSVYRQLDIVLPEMIEPFGRVNDSKDAEVRRVPYSIFVVGKHRETGALVRSEIKWGHEANDHARELPLIVLAGLR